MIGYIFALLPLYVLLYLPLQNMFFGSPVDPSNSHGTSYNESLVASDEPLSCPTHNYNTFVVSRQPLIIYIENFLSPEESKHLLDIRYLSFASCLSFPAEHLQSVIHVTNLNTVRINLSPQQ